MLQGSTFGFAKLVGTGPRHFTGGKALLKPYTIDLVEHASAAGLYVEVLTHGYYWDDQNRAAATSG